MERPEPETRRPSISNAGSAKNRGAALSASKRAPPLPQLDRLRLAETAAKLNVRLRSSDMPPSMQARAIHVARESLGSDPQKNRRLSPTKLAMSLKQEFDCVYGPAWHCIVGKSFGSFVTHASGGFLYFSVDNLYFLLFKTQVRPVTHKS